MVNSSSDVGTDADFGSMGLDELLSRAQGGGNDSPHSAHSHETSSDYGDIKGESLTHEIIG